MEERLAIGGKKAKIALEGRRKQADSEAKSQARPAILSDVPKCMLKSVQVQQTNVVERLYEYQKLYEGKRAARTMQSQMVTLRHNFGREHSHPR